MQRFVFIVQSTKLFQHVWRHCIMSPVVALLIIIIIIILLILLILLIFIILIIIITLWQYEMILRISF